MTPAAAIARRHTDRLYEIADVLEAYLREIQAQKRRAEFYVIYGRGDLEMRPSGKSMRQKLVDAGTAPCCKVCQTSLPCGHACNRSRSSARPPSASFRAEFYVIYGRDSTCCSSLEGHEPLAESPKAWPGSARPPSASFRAEFYVIEGGRHEN